MPCCPTGAARCRLMHPRACLPSRPPQYYDIESATQFRYSGVAYNVVGLTGWTGDIAVNCGFAWVETLSEVVLVTSADEAVSLGYPAPNPNPLTFPTLLPVVPAGLVSPVIAYETYPIQSLTHHTLPANRALNGLVGGGKHLYAATDTYEIFSFTPDGSDPVLVFTGSLPVELHFGLSSAVVFKYNNTFMVKRLETEATGVLPESLRNYSCEIGSTVGRVGGWMDEVVVWYEGADNLVRIDLDKDNDGYWDGQDRFPKFTEFDWDTDNDGEPDASDLVPIPSGYPCTTEILVHPSSCLNDIPIMWMVWGGATLIVFSAAMLIGYNRQVIIEIGKFAETPSVSEDTDERIMQIVDDNSSKHHLYTDLEQYMSKVGTYRKVETIVQLFLLSLTLFSVILVIIPLWDKDHLPARQLRIFQWIDVYTATIFAIDLIFRFVYREDRAMTFRQFFVDNWFDFPSLLCDLPGLTTAGSLNILVVARLLRAIRILKVFRVMRLYRKVTNQSAYLSLVLNHSNWLIPIIALVLLITVAVVIKIVEQETQPTFESYWNCLWFCFVTATTVGYGDMTPQHILGRLLACLLMVCGIGMIGNITARVSERISQSSYQRAQEQERQDRHEDHPAIRLALLELSVTFNPMLALKDCRQEYIDVLNKNYMSPRYMEAAIHQTQAEKIENDLKSRPKRPETGSISTLQSMKTGSIPSLSDLSIRDQWCGEGKKGAVVRAAFVRANGSLQATIPSEALAECLKHDPEFRRLRRTVTQTEQTALDEVLIDLHDAEDKLVDWSMLDDQLVKTQEYHDDLANDACFKQKQLEWNWYKWSEYGAVQKLRNMRKERKSTVPKCMDKLYLLLLRYKLDESYKGVDNWETMYKRLCALIFRHPRRNGLVLEKMFSIGCFEYGVGDQEDNPLETEQAYDWQDPLDEVTGEAEKILKQHNVHSVEGFYEILLAVESVIMQFERVEMARWALHHLQWGKPGMITIIPRPPLLEERGRTNVLNPLLHIPRTHKCQHRIGAGGQLCKKLMIMTKGHYEKVDALTDSDRETVMTTLDDHVLQCHGEACLSNRRLKERFGDSVHVTDLEDDPGGYLACPDGHYFLCNSCAANRDHDEVRFVGNQSSRGSSTGSVGKKKKARPYANAPRASERPLRGSLEGGNDDSRDIDDLDEDEIMLEDQEGGAEEGGDEAGEYDPYASIECRERLDELKRDYPEAFESPFVAPISGSTRPSPSDPMLPLPATAPDIE
eukprot:TRINITY_DN3255_c0_g2_i2.p1 TRINITY_DN3255_c0_g2~~TRINITY_DN3255_c0_g2_i2.p1  ORF type:complete len:1237 (+),score=169.04 TRINITY_DN3255_c0_g2_i2:1183-4893(+)